MCVYIDIDIDKLNITTNYMKPSIKVIAVEVRNLDSWHQTKHVEMTHLSL